MANRWTRVWLGRGRVKAYWRYFRNSGATVIEDGGDRTPIFVGIAVRRAGARRSTRAPVEVWTPAFGDG